MNSKKWIPSTPGAFNMLAANSPAFKPGRKRDSNNDFLQIISNSPLFRAGKLKRPDGIMLGIVLIVSLTVRLVYFLNVYQEIWFTHPVIDSLNFHEWARRIASGELLGTGVFTQSPLYAYWLGLVYRIGGPRPEMAAGLQLLMGVLNCGLIYLLGRRLFTSAVGLIAGLAAALYGVSLFHEGTLLTVTLINFLHLILLLTVYRAQGSESWIAWLLPGLMLGLSIITRPNAVLLLLVLAIWLYFVVGRRNIHIFIRPVAGLVLGVILIVIPVTVRNIMVVHEPIITVSTGGLNFYLGNSIRSRGFHIPLGDLGCSAGTIVEDFKREAEKQTGRRLSYRASNSYWFKKTLDEIRQDPGHWQQLLLDKFLLFLNHYEITTSINYNSFRELAPVLRLPWLAFGVLCPFALLGMILLRRQGRELLPLYGLVLVGFFTNIVLMVSSEYRYVVLPAFFIFAAAAVVEIVRRIRERRWSRLAMPLSLIICFALLSNVDMVSAQAHNSRQSTAHKNFGGLLFKLERYQPALREFALARKFAPNNKEILFALGNTMLKVRQYREALPVIEEAYRLAPNELELMNLYIQALTLNQKYTQAVEICQAAVKMAPRDPMRHFNLGIAYLWAGKDKAADQVFERVLEQAPELAAEIAEQKQGIRAQRTRSGE